MSSSETRNNCSTLLLSASKRMLTFVPRIAWAVIGFFTIVSAEFHCGAGDPCIFVNRDVGWIGREDTEYSEHHPPPVQFDPSTANDTTIFVAISSFRDKLCPVTLVNLFTKAANPNRVTAAVVQQNIPGDIDCLEEYCTLMFLRANPSALRGSLPPLDDLLSSCPFHSNIHMNRLDGNTARGPTWARAYGSKMVGDQEFCLQTDSHMDFALQWDTSMLGMWASTENEYAVLSTYVTDSADYDNIQDKSKGMNGLHEVPNLCIVRFHGIGGMPRNFGTKCLRSFPRPKLTITWGAGLSFSKCHAEKKVPYDPFTPGIFDGEEWSRAARYWTWGYDIYTPNKIFISHNYKKSQSDPNHMQWHGNKPVGQFSTQDSMHRLETLLHMHAGENITEGERMRRSKYGLGDRRSFEQFKEFSGVDPVRRQTTKDKCGNIKYVPFVEHPRGASYIPEFHPDTFVSLEVPDQGSIYFEEYQIAMKLADEQEREREMQRRERESEQEGERPGGAAAAAANKGDIDLSKQMDDAAISSELLHLPLPPPDSGQGDHIMRDQQQQQQQLKQKQQHNLFLAGVADKSNAERVVVGQRNVELLKSVAADLTLFVLVCLVCYWIFIPSRSLKNQ